VAAAVLFDVYETLVDVGDAARRRVLDELAERLGTGLPPGALYARRVKLLGGVPLRFDDGPFRPFRARWQDDGERLLAGLGIDGGGAAYADAWDNLHACASPFPETAAVLAGLRGRYRLAVVADADVAHLMPCLEATTGSFDAVVCSELVGAYKPDPRPFLRACELVGVRAEECVFVGDRPEADIGGAAGVGMATVWVNRRNRGWPAGLAEPNATITSLDALPGALAALEDAARGGR
jgi:2-haloalkanoic acid dehalogenase type II